MHEYAHIVRLGSFDEQQEELDAEVCQAGQLRQGGQQGVELVDLRGREDKTGRLKGTLQYIDTNMHFLINMTHHDTIPNFSLGMIKVIYLFMSMTIKSNMTLAHWV